MSSVFASFGGFDAKNELFREYGHAGVNYFCITVKSFVKLLLGNNIKWYKNVFFGIERGCQRFLQYSYHKHNARFADYIHHAENVREKSAEKGSHCPLHCQSVTRNRAEFT